jgi:hypothetical protein
MQESAAEKDEFTSNANRIDERLWLGSEDAAEVPLELLKKHGVTHILICGFGLRPRHPNDFTYKSLPLIDLPIFKITPHLETGIQFITQSLQGGGTVLVHCAKGRSRSAAMVVAFTMKSRNLSYVEAHNRVRTARTEIALNCGFSAELVAFEKTLREAKH